MARKLIDIEVEEVSIVDAAANRSKFAIIKRRAIMDELITMLKALLGDEFNEESMAKAELPEDAVKAIKGALKILNQYKDDLPGDILGAIKALAKHSAAGAPAQKSEEMSKEDIEKVGARLSKATLEELKKISEAIDGIDMKAFKKIKEIVDGLIKSVMPLDKKAYEGLPEDVRARLAKLDADELEKKQKAESDKLADLVKNSVTEAQKPLVERLDKLEKSKGISKGAKGQEGGDDKAKDDPAGFWPSLK